MKLKLLIPPIFALAVAGSWIVNERRTISTLEQESAALKARLVARASAAETDDSHSSSKPPGKVAKGKEPIDWKKLAASYQEINGANGMGDMRAMIRFQQRLQAMTKEELVNALDEIAAVEIPDEARNQLEQMLIGPLAAKDPEFTLTRYLDRLDHDRGHVKWQLASAMKEWMKKEPRSAIAWFDQQIAAGKFDSKSLDGKSDSRMQFEAAVIGSLISSDLSAAAARLKLLPADQRADVLKHNFGDSIKEENQAAFAKLVREGLAENDQAEAIAEQASSMVNEEGFTKVSEYLVRIEATPAERAASVIEAAETQLMHRSLRGKITREDIDGMRTWATVQSPESTAKATASALSRATQMNHQNLTFSEAATMALEYDQESGSDEVLYDFLNRGAAYRYKDEAKSFAEKITDPELRAKILKRFK